MKMIRSLAIPAVLVAATVPPDPNGWRRILRHDTILALPIQTARTHVSEDIRSVLRVERDPRHAPDPDSGVLDDPLYRGRVYEAFGVAVPWWDQKRYVRRRSPSGSRPRPVIESGRNAIPRRAPNQN